MKRRLICLLAALLLLAPNMANALTHLPGEYLYTQYNSYTATPAAYAPVKSYYAKDLEGVNSLEKMTDTCVVGENVYILCDSELIVLDRDFRVKRIQRSYTDLDGNTLEFSRLTAFAPANDGGYLISRAETGEILRFDRDGKFTQLIGKPDIKGFENVAYLPVKLKCDNAGRIYVVAKGMYEGMVELNPDGSFSRFFGVNKVTFTVSQFIWRLFATKEQLARQQLWLPTDFTNLCIDGEGFIFATSQVSERDDKTPYVKRLNSKGENILRRKDSSYPQGDINYLIGSFSAPVGPSRFIAVDADSRGVFVCLDQVRSRVFGYDRDGRLLFIFGGPGSVKGRFRNPIDVDFLGDNILVTDSLTQSIEVFAPTAYGKAILSAIGCDNSFDYASAEKYWRKALDLNHNYVLAYSGIGRSQLRTGEYREALGNLKEGDDRDYYTRAYEKVRNADLKTQLPNIVAVFAALIVLRSVYKHLKKRSRRPKGGV